MKSKPTRANPRRSEPVTNKPNEELEMGVSGEQNRGEMLAMEFRESRGENEMK
jgi:hypothetical protein